MFTHIKFRDGVFSRTTVQGIFPVDEVVRTCSDLYHGLTSWPVGIPVATPTTSRRPKTIEHT